MPVADLDLIRNSKGRSVPGFFRLSEASVESEQTFLPKAKAQIVLLTDVAQSEAGVSLC